MMINTEIIMFIKIQKSYLISKTKSTLVCFLPAFVMISTFFLTVPFGAAESSVQSTGSQIILQIDKDRYNRGDIMVISGEVKNVVSRIPLTIQIVDPSKNLVHVEQIEVAFDGRFSLPIKIEGPLWRMPGDYTLVAQYGFKHVSSMVTFRFESEDIPTTSTFNVKDLSSGQNFDLNYTIVGSTVKTMFIEPQDMALVVELDSKNQGMIHLQIPRLLLDAKKSDNVDESFLVFVNDDEITSFSEENSDSNYRVLAIPIANGDSKIEIIGTTVVPEFADISSLILIVAVGLVMILSMFAKTRLGYKFFNISS